MGKKKKVKEIKLQMIFNPGKMAFEPVLPKLKIHKSKWTKKKSSKLEK